MELLKGDMVGNGKSMSCRNKKKDRSGGFCVSSVYVFDDFMTRTTSDLGAENGK